jgi:hypothetical protein
VVVESRRSRLADVHGHVKLTHSTSTSPFSHESM